VVNLGFKRGRGQLHAFFREGWLGKIEKGQMGINLGNAGVFNAQFLKI